LSDGGALVCGALVQIVGSDVYSTDTRQLEGQVAVGLDARALAWKHMQQRLLYGQACFLRSEFSTSFNNLGTVWDLSPDLRENGICPLLLFPNHISGLRLLALQVKGNATSWKLYTLRR
jgi:hypothetical protein